MFPVQHRHADPLQVKRFTDHQTFFPVNPLFYQNGITWQRAVDSKLNGLERAVLTYMPGFREYKDREQDNSNAICTDLPIL